MLLAAELRPRMVVRVEGAPYKVIGASYHAGGGKMGGVTHAKLRNLKTGTMREWRFRGDEPVDRVDLERQTMQYLYGDERMRYFMNPESFEQVAVETERLGRAADYLREEMSVLMEFLDGEAVGVDFPDVVEVRVEETAPPAHTQGTDNVWKEARLENGVTVMVPQFIAPGDAIRVEVETGTYLERARKK